MTKLVSVSTESLSLRPLVETASANAVRLLEVGMRRTERRLREFETTYRMATKDLVRRFENDELDETLELAEWIGEYRLLQRLHEKTETLHG